jgi:Co/Zn/Cd efflux system component
MNAARTSDPIADPALRRVIAIVALLNLAYFGIEIPVALAIRSVSLLADSVDFLEDASVNFLIFVALAWTAAKRARMGMLLAAVLLMPTAAFLWGLWDKVHAPVPPLPIPLSVTGLGALAVNLVCAFMLARHRTHGGSLTRAAFLSARNDAFANIAIIAAGLIIAIHPSIWPDVLVGVAIAVLNLGAAKEVWNTARSEQRAASCSQKPADRRGPEP